MRSKYHSNIKQTVKLQPSKDSLPKLHVHNKESNIFNATASGSYYTTPKASNNINKQQKVESLYSNNAQNLIKVSDNIQSLISYLNSAKIIPQQQATLIQSLTTYLSRLKDHKQPASNTTMKKSSRFSKLSLSMVNENTSQVMTTYSQLKTLHTEKYQSRTNFNGNKQVIKDGINLNQSMGLTIHSNISGASMIPKQRYKPGYLKSKQAALTFEKKGKKNTLLLSQTLKTQQQAQSAQSKQATYSLINTSLVANTQQQPHLMNMSSLRSTHITSLCSDTQKRQVHHRAKTQLQEQLESELMIRMGESDVEGERQKSEQIVRMDCDTQTQSNNIYEEKKDIVTISQPQPQPQPQPMATIQPIEVDYNTSLHTQQILALRAQLKQREFEIMNLWMIINSSNQLQIH